MGKPANYRIVKITDKHVYIEDIGPWDVHLSCTNDAEGVVERLIAQRILTEGQQLFVKDSNGDVDEYEIRDGEFFDFVPVPRGWGA